MSRGQVPGAVPHISTVLLTVFLWERCQLQLSFFPWSCRLGFKQTTALFWGQRCPAGWRCVQEADAVRLPRTRCCRAGCCCLPNQAGVREGRGGSRCSQCLSVSNHADKHLTTPSARQNSSPSIYPYSITIQASGHL